MPLNSAADTDLALELLSTSHELNRRSLGKKQRERLEGRTPGGSRFGRFHAIALALRSRHDGLSLDYGDRPGLRYRGKGLGA